jgi:ABC-type branched-subunit amino acid transport system substrate-binding protein
VNKICWFFSFFLLLAAGAIHAEVGVTPDRIVVGQSCALSGPSQDLGTNLRAGIEASFARINDAGGVKGRKIVLISKDDGYEPGEAIRNTRDLIEKDKVFLLIGGVGTPTAQAVVPLAEKEQVPFIGPFTGAEFLRNPFKKYVINVRGSYYQEMERLAQYLVDGQGLKKIACFYQNDGYGQAGLSGIEIALRKRGMELVATGTYERNTAAVKSGLLNIRKAAPEAVVMVGVYKPCAEFIKLAKQIGMTDTVYANISFVGTSSLAEELGGDGDGTIISQVVSFPDDQSVPLVQEYREALGKYQPDVSPDFVSLEGYMVGKFFAMAAESVQGDLTRENFLRSVQETGAFDLGGIVLQYGPGDHQGMDEIFLTIIEDGRIKPLDI